MGMIELDGAPAHVSWSSLESWLSCPAKWYLRKVAHVEERPMWAGVGGTAVHAATEDYDHAAYELLTSDGVLPDNIDIANYVSED